MSQAYGKPKTAVTAQSRSVAGRAPNPLNVIHIYTQLPP